MSCILEDDALHFLQDKNIKISENILLQNNQIELNKDGKKLLAIYWKFNNVADENIEVKLDEVKLDTYTNKKLIKSGDYRGKSYFVFEVPYPHLDNIPQNNVWMKIFCVHPMDDYPHRYIRSQIHMHIKSKNKETITIIEQFEQPSTKEPSPLAFFL